MLAIGGRGGLMQALVVADEKPSVFDADVEWEAFVGCPHVAQRSPTFRAVEGNGIVGRHLVPAKAAYRTRLLSQAVPRGHKPCGFCVAG